MKSLPEPTNARERLIVALDVRTSAEAMHLVRQLSDDISSFKVGLQLYTVAGPKIIRAVATMGASVFLDLKLHDIPNTVAHAVTAASELGVQMLSVHLSGGRAMLEAAVGAKSGGLHILGVTVLTSSDETTLRETGVASSLAEQVSRLAELGVKSGIDGLIASPHEVRALRALAGKEMKIVTPGVRPFWAEPGDQKRFMTPREALQNGADYLVIGRPITAHPQPREAVAKLLAEIDGSIIP